MYIIKLLSRTTRSVNHLLSEGVCLSVILIAFMVFAITFSLGKMGMIPSESAFIFMRVSVMILFSFILTLLSKTFLGNVFKKNNEIITKK